MGGTLPRQQLDCPRRSSVRPSVRPAVRPSSCCSAGWDGDAAPTRSAASLLLGCFAEPPVFDELLLILGWGGAAGLAGLLRDISSRSSFSPLPVRRRVANAPLLCNISRHHECLNNLSEFGAEARGSGLCVALRSW